MSTRGKPKRKSTGSFATSRWVGSVAWAVPLTLAAVFSFVLLRVDGLPDARGEGDLPFSRTRQDSPGQASLGLGGARAAIVIHDLGDDMEPVEKLLNMEIPLSLAVLPYRRHSHEIATRAFQRGKEVLLHVPVEPVGFPMTNTGPGCLLACMGREEIQLELAAQVASLPYCVGVSTHMGSLFMEMPEPLSFLVGFLKERDFFLVDNRGSAVSRAAESARAYGVPFVQRTHLLDEEIREASVVRQLCRMADFAVRHGWALGIGHPYPETLDALPMALAAFREKNVTLVPVSGLLPSSVERPERMVFAVP